MDRTRGRGAVKQRETDRIKRMCDCACGGGGGRVGLDRLWTKLQSLSLVYRHHNANRF